MRALFLTTKTNEVNGHVGGWDCWSDQQATVVQFDYSGIRNDWILLEAAARLKPDVVFYIGAARGSGNPKADILRAIRAVAPFVNLCSDAADPPWHPVLDYYAKESCFDLQVGIDGCRRAPVDLATLTPVDLRYFGASPQIRGIRCGFSGSLGGNGHPRAAILHTLIDSGLITAEQRTKDRPYDHHVAFMQRCEMIVNVATTGSGQASQVKGRVLEAAFAGCALLESAGSPIGDWIPTNCYFTYENAFDAMVIIGSTSNAEVRGRAARLSEYVRANYHPRQIYGSILERLGVAATK